MFYFYALYFLIMNLIGFLTMGIDKKRARRRQRRIPEKLLFGIAVLSGCYGSYLGMRVYHHKTRHKLFSIGLPILMVLHLVLLIIFFLNFA